MSSVPRKLAVWFVVFVLAISLYRAKTQSFSIDEAYVYELYVDQRIASFLTTYDACNHVLHTLLTKFFRGLLGRSELVLRISSLIGALLYLVASFRLTALWFGTGWLRLLALVAFGCNPLVMDFFVASRGYGLALALLLWSIYCICQYFRDQEQRRLRQAGVLSGLAVSANLTVAVPVAVLGAVLVVSLLTQSRRNFWLWLDRFAGPASITAFLLLVLPLAKASAEHFYYGTSTPSEAVGTLLDYSLKYDEDRSIVPLLDEAWWSALKVAVLPAVVIAMLVPGLLAMCRVLRGSRDDLTVGFGLISCLLAGSLVILGLGNYLSGVRLPYGRTGLYLIILFMMTLLLCTRWLLRLRSPIRFAGYGGIVITFALVLLYVAQLNTTYFVEWKADASVHKLMTRLAEEHGSAKTKVQLGSSWEIGRTVEYYRKRRRLGWIAQVVVEKLESTPADYYLLFGADRSLVQKLGLQVLRDDKLSGVVLAKRG